MLFFGHLGFGEALRVSCSPKPLRGFLSSQETKIFLLATILPDLIDKPLYWAVQRLIFLNFLSSESGIGALISSTRTLGHTGLFVLLLFAWGILKKNRYWQLIALGVFTHLLIDPLSDLLRDGPPVFGPAPWFFPLHGFRFQERMFDPSWTLSRQLFQVPLLLMEFLGAGFLAWRFFGKRPPE